MTESEWMRCDDPRQMIEPVVENTFHLSERKARLFGVACARAIWDRLSDGFRECCLVAERFADGLASERELEAARSAAVFLAWDTLTTAYNIGVEYVCTKNRVIGFLSHQPFLDRELFPTQAALLRSILGNPFASSKRHRIDWDELTGAGAEWSIAIAQDIYERHDWKLLPVLADALEDAGCTNEDALLHLRGEEGCPHCEGGGRVDSEVADWAVCPRCQGKGMREVLYARGDWVLDAILREEEGGENG